MRIAFIGQKGFPATWGGVEVHVDEVARRLAMRGHEVVVYNRRWYASLDGARTDGVTVVDVPTLATRSLDAITHAVLCTFSALARGVDVFHYHCMGPSLPSPLPVLAGKAVVATIHGFDYRAAKWGRVARSVLRTGEAIALRAPHRTVVVAEHQREHYAALGHRTCVIRNGVTPQEPVQPGEITRRFGLERDGYLLFIARLEPDKRAHTLIEAFGAWRHANARSNLRLVVAGPLVAGTQYISELTKKASSHVVFPGEAHGMLKAELLANALAVVSPSRFEGLPISLLEALSAGRAVLVSDIPAHREVVEDGAGVFCNAETPSGLLSGLERILSLSEQERRVLGDHARRVAARFSWDDATSRLEQVYREAMASTKRPGLRASETVFK